MAFQLAVYSYVLLGMFVRIENAWQDPGGREDSHILRPQGYSPAEAFLSPSAA